jgi:hypothetical protein
MGKPETACTVCVSVAYRIGKPFCAAPTALYFYKQSFSQGLRAWARLFRASGAVGFRFAKRGELVLISGNIQDSQGWRRSSARVSTLGGLRAEGVIGHMCLGWFYGPLVLSDI